MMQASRARNLTNPTGTEEEKRGNKRSREQANHSPMTCSPAKRPGTDKRSNQRLTQKQITMFKDQQGSSEDTHTEENIEVKKTTRGNTHNPKKTHIRSRGQTDISKFFIPMTKPRVGVETLEEGTSHNIKTKTNCKPLTYNPNGSSLKRESIGEREGKLTHTANRDFIDSQEPGDKEGQADQQTADGI